MNDILSRIQQLSPEKRKLLEDRMRAAGICPGADASLQPAEERDYYEASPAQRRMYLLQQLEGVAAGYNMPWCRRLDGELDHGRLKRSLQRLVERHETLRTRFLMKDGEIAARVEAEAELLLDTAEVRDGEDPLALVRRFIVPFDLERAPLLRALVIRLSPRSHILALDMHHIAADGLSIGILICDLGRFYNDDGDVPPLRLHYRDYALWQRRRAGQGFFDRQLEVWKRMLAGRLPVLDMPLDFPRPAVQSFAGDRMVFRLPGGVAAGLLEFGRSRGATSFMTLLTVTAVWLAKYSGQRDIIVGTPVAGRQRPELGGIVGMFVNTLALRVFPRRELTVEGLLGMVKETALLAFDNQDVPFEQVVEALGVRRDLSRNPLFSVMLALQNMDVESCLMKGIEISNPQFLRKSAKFDLLLNVVEEPGGFFLVLEYCTALFNGDSIRRLTGHFVHLAAQIAACPNSRIGELCLATAEEKRQILTEFNRPLQNEPLSQTIQRMFYRSCRAHPHCVALAAAEKHLSYEALAGWTAMLARRSRERGAGRGAVVALLAERSFELIVGVLAILEAGGCVLPVDVSLPRQRIDFMLRDSGARLTLEGSDIAPWDGSSASSENGLDGSGDDMLYVIYTSGSTGRPKGVMLEHRHLVNLLLWQFRSEGLVFRRVVQFTTISFDVAFQEIFSTLLQGGALLTVAKETIADVPRLLRTMTAWAVETLFLPASFLKYVFNHEELFELLPASIRHIITAGEQVVLNNAMRRFLKRYDVCLHNHYGPSETHVVTAASFESGFGRIPALPPIGAPVDNTVIYIVDPEGRLQPLGVPGELCVGGAQVGRGYLNRVELTAERFGHDPFSGGRMYRTGDLAKWLPGGALMFLGRMDGQVKIRGFRIEPGEIEEALLDMEDVRDAVVLARTDGGGEAYLCAYVATETAADELKRRLSGRLPDYMIPASFVVMAALPLTPNRKVDRRALPDPAVGAEDAAPAREAETPLQRSLVLIWAAVLGTDPAHICIDRSFFDLGGHSLRAAAMVARVERELRAALPLTAVFKHPTIRGLAEVIRSLGTVPGEAEDSGVPMAEKRDYYPLSPAQRRLYAAAQLDGTGIAYNMPQRILMKGPLAIPRFEAALEALARRHAVLRTTFRVVGDVAVQRVGDVGRHVVDFAGGEDFMDMVDFVRPFVLDVAPPWRVALVRRRSEEPVVFLDMHHIVSDNVSQGILRRELLAALRDEGPAPLGVQYVDYAIWLEERLRGAEAGRQREYWREKFAYGLPVLELPGDFLAPAPADFRGGNVCFYPGRRERLPFSVWVAVFGLVLSRLCGQEDMVVGFPVSGRGRVEFEGMLGLFVDPLPLRLSVDADMRWQDYLALTRRSVVEAMEHREGVLEELLAGLSVMVNLVDRRPAVEDRQLEAAVAGEHRRAPSKFDLSLIVYEGEEHVRCDVEYRSSLFRQATIDRFIDMLRYALGQAAEAGDPPLHEIEVMGPEERRLLLEEFNNTELRFAGQNVLHRLIQRQAEARPDCIAISCGDWCLGYRELIERASPAARELGRRGVGPGRIVALSLERGGEMMVGIMAIHMAGGAYLWIDPNGPPERQRVIARSSGASLLVTLTGKRGNNPCLREVFVGRAVFLDSGLLDDDENKLPEEAKAGNPAYVIYTSGTSGKPKGVLVEHGAAVNLVNAMDRLFGGVTARDRCLALTNLSFDVSVWELFLPLCRGARVAALGYGSLLDPVELVEALIKEAVTMAYLPPGLLKEAAALLGRRGNVIALDKLLVGVEPIEDTALESFLRLNERMRIVNGYGPTEACVCATAFVYRGGATGEIVPIGKPLANNRVVLLDRRSRLVPLGAAGELCVAGANLARGYLDNPELTADVFVPGEVLGGARMYRTGDLARWLPDGNLRFLGRVDRQVKIRGFRVEPGEVAARLLEHPDVREAAVADWLDKKGERYLAAYVSLNREGGLPSGLDAFLRVFLPDYMIPAFFTVLPTIPLTAHGKIDRGRLPQPAPEAGTRGTPPATPLEEEAVRLFAEALGVDEETIGMESDFFRLGGHSLKATALAGKIFCRWQARLPLAQFFGAPTPAALCEFLRGAAGTVETGPAPCEEREYYPLTPAQEGVFVKLRYEGGALAYNIPHWIPLRGQVESSLLEHALAALIRRHRILASGFFEVEGQPVQRIFKEARFRLEFLAGDGADPASVMASFVRPFDLACPPLLRALLLRRGGEDDLLLLDVHHLASDGFSLEIFRRELEVLLRDGELPSLAIEYTDVALWRLELRRGRLWQRHREFWLEGFSGGAPLIRLPLDFSRPAVKSFEGALVPFGADEELSVALHRLAAATGTTLYIVLLAAYFVLLHRYTNQEDLVVGSPVMGRFHPALEPVVGLFVNMLALRARPRPGVTFRDFLAEVAERAALCMEHQVFAYEELAAELGLSGDMSRNPLFDVVLAMQTPRERVGKPKKNAAPQARTMAKFDLLLNVFPAPDGIRMVFEYCSRLFYESTVRDMADHYLQILGRVAGDPGLLIDAIDITSGLALMDGESGLDDGDFGF